MNKIAIVSTEKLQFPPRFHGYIEMNIDLIQNKPEQGIYELRITDTCFDWIDEVYQEPVTVPAEREGEEPKITYVEKTRRVRNILAQNTRPPKIYTYEELEQLSSFLKLDRKKFKSDVEYINELFRQGLLLTTQQECVEGISGEGLGMHFSRVDVWVIEREKPSSEV